MNYEEFVKTLTLRTKLGELTARTFVSTCLDIITEAVAMGDEVRIPHFGKFRRAAVTHMGSKKYRMAFRAFKDPNERIVKTMEKYGVQIDEKKEKTAGTKKTCPKCGAVLDSVFPPKCPACGTEPFEKKRDDNAGA